MDDNERAERIAKHLTECVIPQIRERGVVVQGVLPVMDDLNRTAPFAYTIGLTPAGLPELLISGLAMNIADFLLDRAARQHAATELIPGTPLKIADIVDLRVIDAPFAEAGYAKYLYGPQVRVLQLLWPEEGFYPDEPGWPLPPGTQLLYDRKQPVIVTRIAEKDAEGACGC